jgi:membrane-associated phospholipid phosphatase
MILVNVWFTIFVKLILHHPRPYMVVDDQIRVMGTPSEFGDPSGHTMSSA